MLERQKYNKEMDEVRERQVIEIADYLKEFFKINADIRDMPIMDAVDSQTVERVMSWEIPRAGRDPKVVGDELVKDVLSKCLSLQHPRSLAFVTSAVSPYSIAGAVLTDIYNPNIAGYGLAPTASLIEEKLIKWMGSRAGWDENCGGIFTSGGSMSNLTCMIAAREDKLPGRYDLADGVAFYSDQAHSSIIKGMRMMGLRNDQCVKIESDDNYRIRLDLLEAEIVKSKNEGKKPFLLIASIGTTNTGSIDPLPELADIAAKYGMWLHVDGAFGGSILFSDIYKNLAKGIERADSLSWDTHKWAMQTYSCSTALVRDKQKFITAFNEHPEYLEDVRSASHNDGWDLGIEMSRPARCLKLWFTLQAMGTDLLADVIDYSFYNAKQAETAIKAMPDWQVVVKPCCGAINFRYEPKEIDESKYDALNDAIAKELTASGYAFIVTTVLKGKRVIRMCVIGANTETEDVLNTVEKLGQIALEVKKKF